MPSRLRRELVVQVQEQVQVQVQHPNHHQKLALQFQNSTKIRARGLDYQLKQWGD